VSAGAEPPTVAHLLERISTEWSALQATLARLDASKLTTPGRERWSVKDHLAHLSVWERTVPATLRGDPPHAQFGVALDEYRSFTGDEERVNEFFYQRWRDRSLTDVLDASTRVHEETLAAISQLTDPDLSKRMRDFERGDGAYGSEERRNTPIFNKIRGDTYEHYAEHNGWIQELVGQLG
jgi:hypothetical protein